MISTKSDLKKQIKELEDQLTSKEAVSNTLSNDIKKIIEDKSKLKRRLFTIENKDYITDHCIIRYLERVYNFDFEKIKKEIIETKGLEDAILIGASKFKKDNKTFVIENGKIVTII